MLLLQSETPVGEALDLSVPAHPGRDETRRRQWICKSATARELLTAQGTRLVFPWNHEKDQKREWKYLKLLFLHSGKDVADEACDFV